MVQSLSKLTNSLEMGLLRKGPRVFALLGKATSSGLMPFGSEDIGRSWAVTAEYGCLRMERLSGDEEVTELELYLPSPISYDYGVAGVNDVPKLTRAVFGLLPGELEQLVSILRRGSFPVLGYSSEDLKCSITGNIIPGSWPHIVVSNLALYGNVVSVESFMRILISSLPQGHLALQFPSLQQVFKEMMRVTIMHRSGIPYSKDILNSQSAEAWSEK